MSRLDQYLNPSVEEFDNTPVQDETLHEEWVNLPESPASDIQDGIETEASLDQLASRVEATEDQASLEAYDFSFRTIGKLTGLAPRAFVSLEDFSGPIRQRSALAKSIREHQSRLTGAINASLEDYQSTFDGNLQSVVGSIKQSSGDLKSAVGNINASSVHPKKVNHSKIWQMMHINGNFVQDLGSAIREEKSGLDKLLRAIRAGVEGGEMGTATVQLMFNTTAKVNDGSVDFDRQPAPTPKVKPGEVGTGSRWRWTIAGFLLFSVVGAAGGYLIGNARDKKRAEANSTTTEVAPRQVAEVKDFLNALAGLQSYAADLEKIANDIARKIEAEGEDTRKDARRKYLPVMDALEEVGKHIAELIYGGVKLADAVNG